MTDTEKMYKVKANEFEFSFTQSDIAALDMVRQSATTFNIIHKNSSVNAMLLEADETTYKKMNIEVAGENFAITVKDELDMMLDQMGFGIVTHKHLKEIKAPMPGLVLEINVAEGQEVVAGQKLLILVAMKMENSIVIESDAVIKRIIVTAGQAVDKGQILFELE